MNGLHILAEFHACQGDRRLLQDAALLAALCRRACAGAGLEVVAAAFHQFPAAGATGALVLAESHLAIHTWPELDAATCDLYVCNYSQDNRAAAELAYGVLCAELQPERIVRRDVVRGNPEQDHAEPGLTISERTQ
ncbi:adenosylmethionine decarboxylase [Sulfuritalea sp.]|uniref:adenosylmethionine decarboxylase n=1 Tax=Sulfuritalea sp. TaxID=2480090 RepID=UPI00286E0EDD|nr:adenosylmethionine decarboxylase [Sulfuritalea sp.]